LFFCVRLRDTGHRDVSFLKLRVGRSMEIQYSDPRSHSGQTNDKLIESDNSHAHALLRKEEVVYQKSLQPWVAS
jgi:hypothetical protein